MAVKYVTRHFLVEYVEPQKLALTMLLDSFSEVAYRRRYNWPPTVPAKSIRSA